jgi:hypothetical protein
MAEYRGLMRFTVYIDREGSMWPPPKRAPGEPIIVDVEPDTSFGEAVAAALRAGGSDVHSLYYVEDSGPHYSAHSLRDSAEPNPELVAFPRVVIASDGQLLWMWGARDLATFSDFMRARDAGYFDGDPYGVFLERPMYGDGVIPGWEELFEWLGQAAVGRSSSACFEATIDDGGSVAPPRLTRISTSSWHARSGGGLSSRASLVSRAPRRRTCSSRLAFARMKPMGNSGVPRTTPMPLS